MRKNNNNNRRVSLTIDEIREIVRLEIEAAKHNTREKDIERVWFELRNHERLPDGWLSRPQQKREAPKFTLSSMNDKNLHQDLYEDEIPDTRPSVDNGTKHISENENKLLDETVIYELKAQVVSDVIDEIKHELIKSITQHLDWECKRYQEAGKKDGISSIILLPLPQNRE